MWRSLSTVWQQVKNTMETFWTCGSKQKRFSHCVVVVCLRVEKKTCPSLKETLASEFFDYRYFIRQLLDAGYKLYTIDSIVKKVQLLKTVKQNKCWISNGWFLFVFILQSACICPELNRKSFDWSMPFHTSHSTEESGVDHILTEHYSRSLQQLEASSVLGDLAGRN